MDDSRDRRSPECWNPSFVVPDGTATVEVQGPRRIEQRMVLAADPWDPTHAVVVELVGVDEARRQLGC